NAVEEFRLRSPLPLPPRTACSFEARPAISCTFGGDMSAPASEGDRLRLSSEGAKWLIAVVLPLVMAGGYWGFSQNHRLKLEERRTPFRADRPMVEAQPDLPKKSAAEDVRRPIAESVRAEPERRPS